MKLSLKSKFLVFILLAGLVMTACGGPASGGQRTPVPTLVRATLPAPAGAGMLAARTDGSHCAVRTVDLLGAWVNKGSPENDAFDFTDANNGRTCTGTFADDIQPLFNQSNLWYSGGAACTSCHGPDLKYSWAQMDLSSYQGITAGSRRTSPDAKGNDILGGGDWSKAKLNQVLVTGFMPLGRPADLPPKGPIIPAGKPK